MGFYPLLDRAPKGRNESGDPDFWIRRHDEYRRSRGPPSPGIHQHHRALTRVPSTDNDSGRCHLQRL